MSKCHIVENHMSRLIFKVKLQTAFIMTANSINPNQTVLFWLNTVCHIGYQCISADKQADDICRELWKKG